MLAETYPRWPARLEYQTRLQAARQTEEHIIASQGIHKLRRTVDLTANGCRL